MTSRFNNKKGSLSFDDFLQIVCRIYSLKGVNHYLVMWWLLLLSLSSPLGQGSGSLRKQPTFRDVTTGLLMKWRLRNKRRKSILMTRHYLGGVSDWLKQIVSQSEALLGHYGISAFVSRTPFLGETTVVASLNVGCFLRLGVWWVVLISYLDALLTICWFYLY